MSALFAIAAAILCAPLLLLAASECRRRVNERRARKGSAETEIRLRAKKAAGTFKPKFKGN